MTTVAYKLSLATLLSVMALLACAQFARAKSVQWNGLEPSSIYDPSNDPGFNSWSGSSQFSSIGPQNVKVTYNVRVTNADTGAVVQCGSSVPCGTKLKFEFIPHVYTDISWFTTGFAFDSPYGDWVAGAARPYPDMCSSKADKDFIGTYTWSLGTVNQYTALAVDPPAKTTSISSLFSCSGSSSDQSRVCTATGNGTASNSFNFAATTGRYYARIYFDRAGFGQFRDQKRGSSGSSSGTSCYTSNGPMYKGSAAYTLNVPTETISCPITVTDAGTPGSNPTPPSFSSGAACVTGTAFTVSFSSTDPNGHQIRYGIDWDDDGTVDQWVPPSGYVSSGSTQSASRTYSTSGAKNISVLSENDQGVRSEPSPYSFNCGEGNNSCPPGYSLQGRACVFTGCPIGYALQGTACVFSACPSGYVLQGTQCVASNQCSTPNYCNGKDIVDGCTDEVLQTCEWSCFAGRCQGVPAPTASISAIPSLVHRGETSSISWSSQNTTSCTVKSNNQDSWTGLSSPGTISNPIQSQTTFTLRCKGYNGATPGTIQKSVNVNIAPTYEEK